MNDEMWNEFDDVTAEMINSENSSGRRIVEFDEVLYNCIVETARTELRNTLEKLDELGVKLVDNAIIDDCTAYPTKEKGAQWKREQAGRGKRFR